MKILKYIFVLILGLTIGGSALSVGAQLRVLQVNQGGTGASSFTSGECLVGNGTGAITTQTCGAGGGGADGNWTFFNGSGIRLATTTNQLSIGATATTSLAKMEITQNGATGGALAILVGSTTLQNFTFVNATGTQATTTNFFSTTASSTNLFTSNAFITTLGKALNAGGFQINNAADPTLAQDVATKNYVDSTFGGGVQWKQSTRRATTEALPANTYDNGLFGVGATLTGNSNGALSVDGSTVVIDTRILVKNESSTANNGVYTVTAVGDGSNPYILTRTSDYNQQSEMQSGDAVGVTVGTVNANTFWIQTSDVSTVGTDAVTFSQFAISYTAGNGLTLTGSQFTINNGYANVWTALQTFTHANSILATGSTTLQNFTGLNSTTTNATTTSLAVSSLTSGRCIQTTTGGALTSTGGGCSSVGGSDQSIQFNVSGTQTGGSVLQWDYTNSFLKLNTGRLGIGTSTPAWQLTIASSTGPQIALSDTTLTSNHWTFRNAGGLLYIATGSPSTFATSTVSVFSINENGRTSLTWLEAPIDKPTIYASSTLSYDGSYSSSGTTTYNIWNPYQAKTLVAIYCKTDVGTVFYQVGNGTASSSVQCTTSGAENTTSVSFTARANIYEALGNQASNPNRITVTPTFK